MAARASLMPVPLLRAVQLVHRVVAGGPGGVYPGRVHPVLDLALGLRPRTSTVLDLALGLRPRSSTVIRPRPRTPSSDSV